MHPGSPEATPERLHYRGAGPSSFPSIPDLLEPDTRHVPFLIFLSPGSPQPTHSPDLHQTSLSKLQQSSA